MPFFRWILLQIAVLIMLVASPMARAQSCPTIMGDFNLLPPGGVGLIPLYDNGQAPGATLYRFEGTGGAALFQCAGGPRGSTLYLTVTGTAAEASPGIFATGIPGVGVGVEVSARNIGGLMGVRRGTTTLLGTKAFPPNGFDFVYEGRYVVTFYKTGPISGGMHRTATQLLGNGAMRASATGAEYGRNRIVLPSLEMNIVTGTCSIDAGDTNRSITLPSIKARELESADSAGVTRFNLTSRCTGVGRTSVSYVFSGTSDAADPTRFANTGTARGVGIGLQSNPGPSALTIPANGTATQRTRVANVVNNVAVLPLAAAYWKTGTAVVPGSVRSSVRLTMTYN